MATSGSYGMNGGGWNSTFGWSLSSQNTARNNSTIGWWWDANWAGTTWVISSQAKLWVNGSQVFANGYNTGRRMYGGRQASGSTTIGHNTNGTKTFGANGEAAFQVFALNAWGSGNWDLPTIPRHASATGANGDINDEQNPYISYSNPAKTALDVYLELPDLGVSPVADSRFSIGSAASGTYNWKLSDTARDAIRSAMKNVKSTKLRMGLHDSLGGNSRSWKDAIISIINAEPTFTDFDYYDTNTAAVSVTGNSKVLIQSISTPKITVKSASKASPKKGASISKYNIAFDGKTTAMEWKDEEDVSATLGTTTSAGSMKLKVSALDSRSFSTDVSKDVVVLPYSSPVVIASGKRLNDFEDETTIHIEGSISLLQVNGITKNAVDSTSGVKYRYREQGTSAWNNWANIKSATGANGVIGTTNFTLSLDKTKAYEFQVQITDKLKTSTANFTVGVGRPILRIGLDGLCYNNEQPLMPSHIGQVIQSTTLDTAAKVAAIYGGTWVTWGAGRVPVGVANGDNDFGKVNKTGGAKSVTLSVAQMPVHSHGVKNLRFKNAWTATGTGTGNWLAPSAYVWGSNTQFKDIPIAGETYDKGSGHAHSNIQPYTTCYFWRRTA